MCSTDWSVNSMADNRVRPMTHRECRAAQGAWNAFQPDKEHGAFTVCTKGERKRVVAAVKKHVRDTVPECFRYRVSWPVKVITPTLLSIGWSYSPYRKSYPSRMQWKKTNST